jgi:integrase
MCLYLTKRNSTYYFRRVIPTELRSILGAREFTFSLGTKDKDEAKRRRSTHAVRTDRLIEEAWATLSTPTRSTAPPAPAVDVSWEQLELEALDAQEMAEKDHRREELAEYIAFLEDRLKGSTREMPRELRAFRYILEGRQFDNDLLSDQLLVARVEKRELEKKLEALNQAPTPAPSIPDLSVAGAMLDTTIVDLWSAERKPKPKTIDAHRSVARWLYQRVGEKAVDQITRRDVLSFKAKLLDEGQTPANIKQKLSRLRTLLQWAADNGYAPSNAAQGVSIKDTQAAKNKRRSFDLPALNAIFSSPVYAQGDRPAQGRGEAAYWLPLLALFTGARMEEIGQLRPSDVVQLDFLNPEEGQERGWFIHLVEVDGDDGTELKTAESERFIPVHGELERLGFIAFAQAARDTGRDRLFHQLTPGPYGNLTHKWGQWFGAYLRKTCGVADKRMTFHSFRHTFTDYIRRPDIPEGIQRQLVGHSSKDIHDDYGSGYNLYWLVEAMKLYKVPGLSLSAPIPPEEVATSADHSENETDSFRVDA